MTLLDGAVPPFAVDGGILLAIIRSLFDASLFAAAGSLVFATLLEPAAHPPRLVRPALLAALALGLLWFAGETAAMSDATGPASLVRALPVVLLQTEFGHLLSAQILLLALGLAFAATGATRARSTATLACAVAALLLHAGHGHAWSMSGPSLLLLSDALHLAAGAAWLGSLLPLLFAIRSANPQAGAALARRFSPLGRLCVTIMAVTALYQGIVLVGSIPALFGTAYGWTVCVKTLLFGLLVALAALNQFRLVPALAGADPGRARRRLVVSIAVETTAGGLVLLAAGLLASLPPGMHTEPVWPFAQQISLVTVREDPDFRREVMLAASGVAASLVLAVAACWFRPRPRLAAWAVALLAIVLAIPHFDLLFVEAWPTSFATSPTGFSVDAVAEGSVLFARRCAGCHGADGSGHGPLAASLPIPPDDLTSPMIRMHTDGELFWWLGHGIEGPDGRLAMPGFAATLSPRAIWSLIDDLRAHAAAITARADHAPVRAPGFEASCGGETLPLPHWRGRPVLLALGSAPAIRSAGSGGPGAAIIVASPSTPPGPADCTVADQNLARAYAVAAGMASPAPAGTVFLLDPAGDLAATLVPDPDRPQDLATRLASALRRPAGGKPSPSQETDTGMNSGMRM